MQKSNRPAHWRRIGEDFLIAILAFAPAVVAMRYHWSQIILPLAMVPSVLLIVLSPETRAMAKRVPLEWLQPTAIIGLIATLWLIVSLAWAPDRALAGIATSKALGTIVCALTIAVVLATIGRGRIFLLLVWFTVAAICAGLFSVLSDGAILRAFGCCKVGLQADRTGVAVTVALFVWPCAGWLVLRGKRMAALFVFLLTCGLISVSKSGAAGLALLAGTATVCLGAWRPRAAVTLPIAIVLGGFASALFLGNLQALPSQSFNLLEYLAPFHANARIEIWSYYTDLFWKRPWTGYGVDAARTLGRASSSAAFTALTPPENAQLHPHSAPLQILVEFGFIGAILALATATSATASLMHRDRTPLPFAVAPASAFAAAALVNFGLWESWWLAVISIVTVFSSRLLRADLTAPATLEPGSCDLPGTDLPGTKAVSGG